MLEQSSLKKENLDITDITDITDMSDISDSTNIPNITNGLIIKKIVPLLDPDFQSLGNLNITNKYFHEQLKTVWRDLINKYSSTLKNDYPAEYNDNPSSLFVKRVWHFFKARIATKAKESEKAAQAMEQVPFELRSLLPQGLGSPAEAIDFQYMQKELFNMVNDPAIDKNYITHLHQSGPQSFFLAHLSLYQDSAYALLIEKEGMKEALGLVLTHAVRYGHEEKFETLLVDALNEQLEETRLIDFGGIAAQAQRTSILLKLLAAFPGQTAIICQKIMSKLRQEESINTLASDPNLLQTQLSNFLSSSMANPAGVGTTEFRVSEPQSVLFLKDVMKKANIKENPSANQNGIPVEQIGDNNAPCCLQ